MNRKKAASMLALCAGFAGLCWWTYQNQFGKPMATLRSEIETLRSRESQISTYLKGTRHEPEQLAELRQRSLGSTTESVVHQLRVVLRAAGERAGIRGVTVDSRPGRGVTNPVPGVVKQPVYVALRDRPDYVPVIGSLRGVGRYEAAMAVVAMLTSSDRLIRVDKVRMVPVSGDDREQLDILIEVTTIFSPGYGPSTEEENAAWLARLLTVDEPVRERVTVLSARQPFLPPAPPPQAVAQQTQTETKAPPPPPPPPPPYGEWQLVGVVARASSPPEAMLTNTRTNEVRRLKPGDSVLGVTFIGPGVDANRPGRAIFEKEQARIELRVGQTLASRGEQVG